MYIKESKVIDQLFRVLTELDARECSGNLVIKEYEAASWKELCDIGIELLMQLK